LAFSVFCAFFPCVTAFFAVETLGHGPIVSPWRRWAGSALRETVIVTNGFFCECVW
jgi:hypothetical protein